MLSSQHFNLFSNLFTIALMKINHDIQITVTLKTMQNKFKSVCTKTKQNRKRYRVHSQTLCIEQTCIPLEIGGALMTNIQFIFPQHHMHCERTRDYIKI